MPSGSTAGTAGLRPACTFRLGCFVRVAGGTHFLAFGSDNLIRASSPEMVQAGRQQGHGHGDWRAWPSSSLRVRLGSIPGSDTAAIIDAFLDYGVSFCPLIYFFLLINYITFCRCTHCENDQRTRRDWVIASPPPS